MCFNNQRRKSKNSLRHWKIKYNLKSNVDPVLWGSRHRDYNSGRLCLQLCPVGHYDEECVSTEKTWQSMSGSARVTGDGSGLHPG